MPDLRQELRIEPGAPLVNGAPSWTLFDPVRHAFFQLGKIEFRIFSSWARGIFDGCRRRAEGGRARARKTSMPPSPALLIFHSPIADRRADGRHRRHLSQETRPPEKGVVEMDGRQLSVFPHPAGPPCALFWNAHCAGWSRFDVGTGADPVCDGRRSLGLLLVSRQWDAFMASFLYFFSWDGIAAYALGLSAVKVIHELGHAYTATRFGCRVPSMGVSFLVMFPVLYTDTTGAWRLTSAEERLAIDCAGVTAELMLASLPPCPG